MAVNPKELWPTTEEDKPSVKLAELVELKQLEQPPEPSYRSKYAALPVWTVSNGSWGKRAG